MDWNSIFVFTSVALAILLGAAALLREARSVSKAAFVAIMFLLAVEAIADGLRILETSPDRIVLLQRVSLLAASFLPCAWLVFSLSYSRGNAREFLARWRPALIGSAVIPISLALWVAWNLSPTSVSRDGYWAIGSPGLLLHAFHLIAATFTLMNLERTFRTATGTMRWRVKYLILGCGVLLGARIYISSQAILFSGVTFSRIHILAASRLIGLALIGFSLFRSRLAEIDLYPSHAFLYRSLTAVLAGAYLVVVGLLAHLALVIGGDHNLPLKAFVILGGLVGLAIVLMSDRIRLRAQRAVSRHLRRPLHDYRQVWTTFASRTGSLVASEELCREVARFISETFNVLSVSIFLVDDQKRQLRFGASTSLPGAAAKAMLDTGLDTSALANWTADPTPVDLDASTEPWVAALKKLNPDHFQKGGDRVCIPLVASGQFLGLVTLTDRVSGIPLSPEDFDLLKCIAGQTSASLLNIRLSASLVRAKELEAFQTMSTFFVHDLKNTALMLSLMLENLPVHFANPDFRKDSLRSISKTVDRINDLISRLGLLREGLTIRPTEVQLNDVVASSLAALPQFTDCHLTQSLGAIPPVQIDREQIQKVLANLVLNARDATGPNGNILVSTSLSNGWAVLQVTDDGCGIPPEFISHSLFRPFQTTKKKGIGIGMYQSKMIVDAHAGKIEVESELGKGSTFRVLLPVGFKKIA